MDLAPIARVIGILIDPVNALYLGLLMVAILLWLRRWHVARGLVTLIIVVLTFLVFAPIGSLMLAPLEQRFPMQSQLPGEVQGIVLLGGAQQPRLSKAYGQAALNERAERMTTFLALARRYPLAKLVASGGSVDPLHPDVNEAETTRMFLNEQGFDSRNVIFEARSRNTYENVVFSKRLAAPMPGETWLLITSAADLPRAVGVFRKHDWPVIPVPCDYSALPPEWLPSLSLLAQFRLIHHATHEWAGLAYYYLSGKTQSFFPGP